LTTGRPSSLEQNLADLLGRVEVEGLAAAIA
jgi:hypothetical protein